MLLLSVGAGLFPGLGAGVVPLSVGIVDLFKSDVQTEGLLWKCDRRKCKFNKTIEMTTFRDMKGPQAIGTRSPQHGHRALLWLSEGRLAWLWACSSALQGVYPRHTGPALGPLRTWGREDNRVPNRAFW